VAEGLSCSSRQSLRRAAPFTRGASAVVGVWAMEEVLRGKWMPPPGATPLAPATRWVGPATVELESHLTLPPT
jgi:hypothetical protein